MGSIRAQLPERCPECKHDPTGDDEEFRSGGGWSHSVTVDDGVWTEEMRCPRCGEIVARDEQQPTEGRP